MCLGRIFWKALLLSHLLIPSDTHLIHTSSCNFRFNSSSETACWMSLLICYFFYCYHSLVAILLHLQCSKLQSVQKMYMNFRIRAIKVVYIYYIILYILYYIIYTILYTIVATKTTARKYSLRTL